jgi:hypothetical protein
MNGSKKKIEGIKIYLYQLLTLQAQVRPMWPASELVGMLPVYSLNQP